MPSNTGFQPLMLILSTFINRENCTPHLYILKPQAGSPFVSGGILFAVRHEILRRNQPSSALDFQKLDESSVGILDESKSRCAPLQMESFGAV